MSKEPGPTYAEAIREMALSWAREAKVPEEEHPRFLKVVDILIDLAAKGWLHSFLEEEEPEQEEIIH